MRIVVAPLSGELETLDHKRGRLQEILDCGIVSADMRADLQRMVEQIDRRVRELCAAPADRPTLPRRQAA